MRIVLKCLSSTVIAATLVISAYAQNQSNLTTSSPSLTTPLDQRASAAQRENYDPLLDLPPLPHHTVTLIGGTVVSLDEVMNRMVLQPFGTKQKLRVHFDTRTHFYRDGKAITEREVKQGQRVYLDSMLNGDRVFAKSIWIQSSAENGIGRGQIIQFDPQGSTLTVRDELANEPLKLKLTPATVIHKAGQAGSTNDLTENALVSMTFGPQKEVREITVLATPGSTFTFGGRVTYLDLSRKVIAVDNRSDGKNYDVYVDAIAPNVLRQMHEGEEVSVSAVFDGDKYSARSVNVVGANSSQQNP